SVRRRAGRHVVGQQLWNGDLVHRKDGLRWCSVLRRPGARPATGVGADQPSVLQRTRRSLRRLPEQVRQARRHAVDQRRRQRGRGQVPGRRRERHRRAWRSAEGRPDRAAAAQLAAPAILGPHRDPGTAGALTPQDASATHAPPPRNPKSVPDTVPSLASDAALAGHPAGLRRTFAIISHPDAGKTTLTEKLLLFGGAIHVAGAVKARGEARRARSDWMKIEQQRGISVTTSVMHFEYGGAVFNLLDTPGHEDFSEDTYRTLTAVDSAVMVIDAAKGIEARTRKLFEICRLRDVPIITFINKMDREAKDPIELLDEIASTLALDVAPMTWPT